MKLTLKMEHEGEEKRWVDVQGQTAGEWLPGGAGKMGSGLDRRMPPKTSVSSTVKPVNTLCRLARGDEGC